MLLMALVLSVFCISGCSYREYMIEHFPEKLAETEAAAYIQSKYDFSPDILSSGNIVDCGLADWNYLGSVIIVSMSHEGKNFTVNVTLGSERSVCTDNYQQDEIKAALMSYLGSRIDGIKDIYLDGSNVTGSKDIFLYEKDHFDVGNLPDVLAAACPRTVVWLVDEDLSCDEDFAFLDTFNLNFDVTFVSFRSEEAMEACLASERFMHSEYVSVRGWIKREAFAEYIDSYRICGCINGGKDEYRKLGSE